MADIVQIDEAIQLCRQTHVGFRRDIGGKHDVVTFGAYRSGCQQFRIGRTVQTEAFIHQDLKQDGIRVGLHGEVLAKPGFQAKADFSSRARCRMTASSYR